MLTNAYSNQIWVEDIFCNLTSITSIWTCIVRVIWESVTSLSTFMQVVTGKNVSDTYQTEVNSAIFQMCQRCVMWNVNVQLKSSQSWWTSQVTNWRPTLPSRNGLERPDEAEAPKCFVLQTNYEEIWAFRTFGDIWRPLDTQEGKQTSNQATKQQTIQYIVDQSFTGV